jgi:uncharacterized protein (TIGR02391 family)
MPRTIPPTAPRAANLSTQQMKGAIPKLQRRLSELEGFDVSTITERFDSKAKPLLLKLQETLAEVFGYGTIEYNRYSISSFDQGSVSIIAVGRGGGPSRETIIGYHRKGFDQAISNLETILSLFAERLEDAGESPGGRSLQTLEGLDLHPEIARAATSLFKNGHYANAVEDACKVLDLLVKMRSGRAEPSGTELMQLVFSSKNPVLKFNDMSTESERSEQMGMMFLYAGAMLALRNPRAHELIEDNPETALEYIGLLNLLAKALDRSQRA